MTGFFFRGGGGDISMYLGGGEGDISINVYPLSLSLSLTLSMFDVTKLSKCYHHHGKKEN